MHKIKKYQWPSGEITKSTLEIADNFATSLSKDFFKNWNNLKMPTGTTPIKSSSYGAAPPVDNSLMGPPPHDYGSGKLPFNERLKGFADKLKNNKSATDLLGAAPELVGAGIEMFGVDKADHITGADSVIDTVGKIGLNPTALAATGGLSAIPALFGIANKYAGKTLKSKGTNSINMHGYTPEMEQAGKYSLTSMMAGNYKKHKTQNQGIVRNNILKGAASYKSDQDQIAAQNSFSDIEAGNYFKTRGNQSLNMLVAKHGAKILPSSLSNIKNKANDNLKKLQEQLDIIKGFEVNETEINEFKEGGKLNVIPEGALHARKNNYEGELADKVTNKGIPVITYDEGGDITQHAEIEHSEIIFNIDTSTKLEDYFEEYKKTDDLVEKAALELTVGKFLTKEILENTQDNIGLLNNE